MYDGATRTLTINGPGQVYGGVNADRCRDDHQLHDAGVPAPGTRYRFDPIKLLDLGVQKVFQFNGGRQRIKLILDAFNVFNINTITAYASGNKSRLAARSRARSCRRACSVSGRSWCSSADRGRSLRDADHGSRRDADHADHGLDGTRITRITD